MVDNRFPSVKHTQMVNLTSCPVFTVILVVGALFFYTSKVTLDLHLINESNLSILLGPSSARDRSWHLDPLRTKIKNNPGIHQILTDIINGKRSPADITVDEYVCKLKLPSTCELSNNLIRYWEEETEDCFQSPLRSHSGLQVKRVEDRRYLVFQPDLGGWNNIRMALEVAILFAHATGRILVLPPHAVLYLLHMNKKWNDNKASMEDFLDFDRMRAGFGMETITMKEFLTTVALPGLLSKPLPNNNTDLVKQPLWDYLESASYVRQWSPGKTFLGFNLSVGNSRGDDIDPVIFGDFHRVSKDRLNHISLDLQRQLLPYDKAFHTQRAVYFPGHDKNRLLTLWYSYFFFAEPKVERSAKRYMRDRVRYHDIIFCAAGRVIDLLLQEVAGSRSDPKSSPKGPPSMKDIQEMKGKDIKPLPLVTYSEGGNNRVYRFVPLNSSYIAYHIRRGDFQQKHTRLDAQDILDLTLQLIPGDPKNWVVYVATDERNRTFFDSFVSTFKSVRFLSDYEDSANLGDLNQNHLGMLEQVVCSNAHTFIGTPLSTFTSFITRMRGYMDRSVLVEVEVEPAQVILKSVLSLSSNIQKELTELKKTKDKKKKTKTKLTTLRPGQLGRPVTVQDFKKEKLVGKVFRKKGGPEIIKPYSGEDITDFQKDLANNPQLFLKRCAKTIYSEIPKPLPYESFQISKLRKISEEINHSLEYKVSTVAVGMYERTYYFMDRFTYQLQDKPDLNLPFWVRDFSMPFENTEEESNYEE